MPVKIVYLDCAEGTTGKGLYRLIQSTYGKAKVEAPKLRTEETKYFIYVGSCAAVLGLIAGAVLLWLFCQTNVAIGATAAIAVLCVLVAYLTYRFTDTVVQSRATKIAEALINRTQPSVIAAYGTAVSIVVKLKALKIPTLLFAPYEVPSIDGTHLEEYLAIQAPPYVLIVHGSHDKVTPLNNSIRIIESGELGYCRLEVIEDDETFHTMTEESIRSLVQEVFEMGKANISKQTEEGSEIASDQQSYDMALDFEGASPRMAHENKSGGDLSDGGVIGELFKEDEDAEAEESETKLLLSNKVRLSQQFEVP